MALYSEDRFFKGELYVYRNISPSFCFSPATATEKFPEDVAQIKFHALTSIGKTGEIKSLGAEVLPIVSEATTLRSASCARRSVGSGESLSVHIVLVPLLVVRKDAVSLVHFLELIGVATFLIGVMLVSELPKGLLDLVLAGLPVYPQYVVVIFCHYLIIANLLLFVFARILIGLLFWFGGFGWILASRFWILLHIFADFLHFFGEKFGRGFYGSHVIFIFDVF